jgi:L-aspartate oxidase
MAVGRALRRSRGLFTTIRASEENRVLIITKPKSLLESNTRYAQGGIAAAISDAKRPARVGAA